MKMKKMCEAGCRSSFIVLILLFVPSFSQSTRPPVIQEKGVILKITDSGKGGRALPEPLGSSPKRVVDELNRQGVTEVRVQVNNGDPMQSVIEAGARATDTLAKYGFKGRIILDNKHWHLERTDQQREWVTAVYRTWEAMGPEGKSMVGGFSFGETTPSEEGWEGYAYGVPESVRILDEEFKRGGAPQALKGKRFYVGGASFGGSFRALRPKDHDLVLRSIEEVGGILVYAYKSFHTRNGLPKRNVGDLESESSAKRFLLDVAGLANLAKVAGGTEVQYRGDAGDRIVEHAVFRAALIDVFRTFPNFLHVGAEIVLPNQEGSSKDGLFDRAGVPNASVWEALNGFYSAIRK